MINRIILIGNGFDLAHGMKTSYWDFMHNYWQNAFISFRSGLFQNDEFELEDFIQRQSFTDHNKFLGNITASNNHYVKKLNNFFLKLSKHLHTWDWVDVETSYYKDLLMFKNPNVRNFDVKKLNKDFEKVKILLEKYLTSVEESIKIDERIVNSVKSIIRENFIFQDFSEEGLRKFSDKMYEGLKPYFGYGALLENDLSYLNRFQRKIVIENKNAEFDKDYFFKYLKTISMEFDLNSASHFFTFNYTKTESYYVDEELDIVTHIHGELNNKDNPIIFGYGDELDDDYKVIEKLNDNDFLENVKSINYANTSNYKDLLQTINSGLFQVYILGHSCGNSDRTLLNTIFEHDNCLSIKPFFYQKSETEDDYLKIYKNISRNFNDKAKLRDRVVNKKLCRPLVPLDIQKAVADKKM